MTITTPTRYPGGVTNTKVVDPLGRYILPDPTSTHQLFDDFNIYSSASWTNTTTGAGTAALVAGDGGWLALATSATSADNVFLQKTTEGFAIVAGQPAWFKARVRLSALTAQIVMGLQVTDTTPLDVTDGIYFLSAATTGILTGYVRKDATTGSSSVTAGALIANVFTDLAWFYDGKSEVSFWQDGVKLASIPASVTNLPDTTLTVSFGIQTSSAAAKTLTTDYILAATSRR